MIVKLTVAMGREFNNDIEEFFINTDARPQRDDLIYATISVENAEGEIVEKEAEFKVREVFLNSVAYRSPKHCPVSPDSQFEAYVDLIN